MSDNDSNNTEEPKVAEMPSPEAAPDAEETAPENQEAEAPAEEQAPEEETTPPTPEEELAKWKDLALRSRADLENYRKRVAREQSDVRAYAKADILRGLLPVLDNFEMGLQAAKQEDETSMLYQGMAMVSRQISDFLTDNGVDDVEIGEVFDPNTQEAVSQEASEDIPEGSIIRVTRRGYKMGERLLRAANVVVSSGNTPQEEAQAES